jgi:hypothetical protein
VFRPGRYLKPWGGLKGLTRTLESVTMTESGGGFDKDARVIGKDGGGVNHVERNPDTVVDDLGIAAGVGVGGDSDANDLLAPDSDGGDAMANDDDNAIDLLASGGHDRREDEGKDGQETAEGVVLDAGAGVVLELDASGGILTSVGASATPRGMHDSILLHAHGDATTGDVGIVLLADGGFAWPVEGALGMHSLGIVTGAVGSDAGNRGTSDVLYSGVRGAMGGSSAISGGEGCGLRVRCSTCTSDWIETASIKSTVEFGWACLYRPTHITFPWPVITRGPTSRLRKQPSGSWGRLLAPVGWWQRRRRRS